MFLIYYYNASDKSPLQSSQFGFVVGLGVFDQSYVNIFKLRILIHNLHFEKQVVSKVPVIKSKLHCTRHGACASDVHSHYVKFAVS